MEPSGNVLLVEFEGGTHEVEFEPELGLEVLQMQLYSLLGVLPEEQDCPALSSLVNLDDVTASARLTSLRGQRVQLARRQSTGAGAEEASQERAGAALTEKTGTMESAAPSDDAEIARKLQEEMDAAFAAMLQQAEADSMRQARAQAALSSGSQGARTMEQRLRSSLQTVLLYEDPARQAKARGVMPLNELEEGAAIALAKRGVNSASEGESREALLQQLLVWFKGWFRWVDSPKCLTCPDSKGSFVGPGTPTAEDLKYGGQRVELHRCNQCGSVSRFVRYNDPAKLLDTREGRCGEWANAFTLCCRALGYDARQVVDWTDHVWTECFSVHQSRWVHMDPCEAAYDTPLLYEKGWGKKLSYVFGISRDGVRDVIRRYTATWQVVAGRRRELSEEALSAVLARVTEDARRALPSEVKRDLKKRDEEEDRALLGSGISQGGTGAPREGAPPSENLPGRQTGSLEWRLARGELGDSPAQGPSPGVPTVHHGAAGASARTGPELWWQEKGTPARDEHVGKLYKAVGAICKGAFGASSGGALGLKLDPTALPRVLEKLKGASALVNELRAQPFRERHMALQLDAEGGAKGFAPLSGDEAQGVLEAAGFLLQPGGPLEPAVKGALRSLKVVLPDGENGGAGKVALGLLVAKETLRRATAAVKKNMGSGPAALRGGNGPSSKQSTSSGTANDTAEILASWLEYLVSTDRLAGCHVAASKESPPKELAVNLADGLLSTKWLHPDVGPTKENAEVQYRTKDSLAVRPVAYCLTSGDDCPERDPKSWALMGSMDGGATWKLLDEQNGEEFPLRIFPKVYEIPKKGVMPLDNVFKLVVSETRDRSSNLLQLTGFEIFLEAQTASPGLATSSAKTVTSGVATSSAQAVEKSSEAPSPQKQFETLLKEEHARIMQEEKLPPSQAAALALQRVREMLKRVQ